MKGFVPWSMTRKLYKVILTFLCLGFATKTILWMLDIYMDGTLEQFLSQSYKHYNYPLEIDMKDTLQNALKGNANSFEPINKIPYQYVKKPNCPEEVSLLVIVRSAPENLHNRAVLRRTWADSTRKEYAVTVIYHTGLTRNQTIASLIDEESSQFHDILQSDFYDHYYNITYKSIMGLKYAYVHCKQAKFVLYVDDDYYVSIPNAISFLKERQKHNCSRLWTGYASFHTVTERGHGDDASKSALSLKEYPFDYLPPFVHGGAYMMSSEVVRDFLVISEYTKYLKLDDVFLGVVGKKLNMTPYHNTTLFSRPFMKPLSVYDLRLRHVIASHRVGNVKEVEEIWSRFSRN